jgi:group I intron endonuclease
MNDKPGTIYCYTNKITGKKYIGQTIRPEQRKASHLHEAIRHKNDYYFHRSIRKHGWENFEYEVLEENVDSNLLSDRETYYIKTFGTLWPNGYNELEQSHTLTTEIREKISTSQKERFKKMTDEQRAQHKINSSKGAKGKPSHPNQKRITAEKLSKSWIIKHPDGTVENVVNLQDWSRKMGFGTNGQTNLVRGSYKGYRCQKVINS